MINYDDFKKVELKVGEIKEVEVVEDADKLLKLTVDLGEEEPRQIVSGIRKFFDNPQDLVGVKCPFVTNLEPREIRGLVSNGMIAAVLDGDNFSLLKVEKEISVGSRVS